ncbi:MAG: DUF4965 domain-containing protein [Candidatus Limiplasma sp.]|nr:DUF4965 domain-containing protein [Candidatus Limiplasma sp.]
MPVTQRMPAYPLVTSDPYCSIWLCADAPAGEDTRHWTGERKRLEMRVEIDGVAYALLGKVEGAQAAEAEVSLTPTATTFTYHLSGIKLRFSFCAPLLLSDWDLLSTPVTFLHLEASCKDGQPHALQACFSLYDDICYDGLQAPPMFGDVTRQNDLNVGWMGQRRQNLLCHSGDLTSIDWGYAYLCAQGRMEYQPAAQGGRLAAQWESRVDGENKAVWPMLFGYDDIASIHYFGHFLRPWYARNGQRFWDAMLHCWQRREEILARCQSLDLKVLRQAERAGGIAYQTLVCAAYRQSVAAHKLVADEQGRALFVSKENGSNGCMGTTDVSYPSIPLFLLFAPELVRAMCRPILRFAESPGWPHDFAPHDVGRYPHATGQVYGLLQGIPGKGPREKVGPKDVFPPLVNWEGQKESPYDLRFQMPVEECGDMLIMLAAAVRADGNTELPLAHWDTLQGWADYLAVHGEDPGEQLCTDDFAGHLAHNVNLALKATYGVLAFGWMAGKLGKQAQEQAYQAQGREMLARVLARADKGTHTALTLDGKGWSLKYNALWDQLLEFHLLPPSFFAKELAKYEEETRRYGIPLDNRALYTKSDWQMWMAASSGNAETVARFAAPIARYLAETPSRFPFPDWYETEEGVHHQFINRSVQGGVFMALLWRHWVMGEKE